MEKLECEPVTSMINNNYVACQLLTHKVLMSSWKAPETIIISSLRMRAATPSSSDRSHAPGMLFPSLTLEFWSVSQTLLSSGGAGPCILGPSLWKERKPFKLTLWVLSPLFAKLEAPPLVHLN